MALLEPVKLKLFFPENLIIQKDSWKLTSLMAEEIKNLFQHTILFVCSLFPHEILTSFFKKEKKNAFSFHSGCCCCSVTKLRLTLVTPWIAASLPCPSLSPQLCSNSGPLNQWCHPAISSSVAPFHLALNLSQHQGLF